MPKLYCPDHQRKTNMVELLREDQNTSGFTSYQCDELREVTDEPCFTQTRVPVIETPLISLPFGRACRVKFMVGRAEHGPIFLNNPIEEIDMELIDAMNYADEAIRQGFDEAAVAEIQALLRLADEKVRTLYHAHNNRAIRQP